MSETVSNDYFCTLEFDNVKKCRVRLNTGNLMGLGNRIVCSHKYNMYKELNDPKQYGCERVSSIGQVKAEILCVIQDPFKRTLLKTKAKTLFKELAKKEKKNENS
jgi:hypothetical protein